MAKIFGSKRIAPPALSKDIYLDKARIHKSYAQFKVGKCCEDEGNIREAILWYQKAAENCHRPYEPARIALERLQKEQAIEAKLATPIQDQKAHDAKAAEEKSKREKAEHEKAENEKIARELKERQEKEAKKKEEKADQKHPEVKTESKPHEVKTESDVKAIVDPAIVKSLVDEVGRQKSIIERLEEAKHEPLLDTKTLTEKQQELDDLSHNMARVTGTTLKLLQDRATELRQVIARQTELNSKELELKIIKSDDALSDYYYTVLILLTDCVSACKVTHAKIGPASLANSKMNMDDYVVSLMKAIGGNIPVLSMFTNTIAGAHGFISSRGKLEQIN
ncbi:MAG: hypothetical protein M1561_00005, partial [Gammaproteobacteria bacterium]|nr:hypothetical protein [Gammaproteobacteria bacterium]